MRESWSPLTDLPRHSWLTVLVLCLMVVGGCGSSSSAIERPGPDASLSRLPQGSVDGMWPSGDLRTVIVRPTFDESPAGVITRDSRTTLAILDPERATWVLGARLTEQEGLDLTQRLQQLMIEHSLLEQRERASGLVVELLLQPENDGSFLPVQGGKWHVLTENLDSDESTIRLGVVDGQSGRLVGEAAMDLVIARDLMHRLAAAIRSPAY